MKTKKEKKIKILKLILYIIVGICFIYNTFYVINMTINEKDYLKVFGITFLNMENNLMQGDINEGDLVIIKEANKTDLQEGDIIAYTVNGQTRINKIINTKDGYTTKSNKNFYPDIEKITHNQVIGKKVLNIPYMGLMIEILQSKITNAFVILCLVLYFIYNKKIYMKKMQRARKKKMLNMEI